MASPWTRCRLFTSVFLSENYALAKKKEIHSVDLVSFSMLRGNDRMAVEYANAGITFLHLGVRKAVRQIEKYFYFNMSNTLNVNFYGLYRH